MLKGNLIVGKNLSVVVHAESLHDLIKLAESKGHGAICGDSLRLRVDLAGGEITAENFFEDLSKSVRRNPLPHRVDKQ